MVVLIAVALIVLARDPRQVVRPRPVDVPRASPAAAAAALTLFVAGVDSRDSEALAALAPTDDSGAAVLLAGVGRNADALDLRSVSARYVDQVGTVADDGTWTGIVELTWRVGTLDRAPSEAEVAVSFAPVDEGLGIAGFAAGEDSSTTRVPLWLRGRLSVARTNGVLVMADGERMAAVRVVQRVARGIGVVRRVLPEWRGSVVVEVPATAAELDETLGAAPGTYSGIAAVTTTAGSPTVDDAPVHVFVNPDVTAGLRRTGAQVVMSHELVHVATDAARTPMEPWLLEGFADYVALRDTNLADRTTLGRAIALARQEGVPEALPAAADFDTRADDLQAAYEQAWLACRIVAERLGERGLVSLYREVARGVPIDRPLRGAGLVRRDLVRAWRERLRDLAR